MGQYMDRGCVLRDHRNLCTALGLALAAVLCATDALASEGHGYRWDDLAYRVVNIVIFVGILWYFVGGLCKKFFRGRRQEIAEGLDNLEQRRATAREELARVEQRIADLDAECRAIVDEARAQGENAKKAILEEARRQADQVLEQARLTAENEGRAVLANVRAVLADEIVTATEKALAQRLDAAAQDALITKSLNKVVLQ